MRNRTSTEIISNYSGGYTTEAEQEEFERETGILLDKAEERKQKYMAHIKKVLEYMESHDGKTPSDASGPVGRKLYIVRHALRNQKLIDINMTPSTPNRLPKEIAKMYLIGDPDGIGGIWLNRDENGKIEPPGVPLKRIDKGEIYR